jgi:GNAT superfamily N-acetyltransferase
MQNGGCSGQAAARPVNGWRRSVSTRLAEDMDLQRLDPASDADAVRACHEIYLACAPLDEPGMPPMPYPAFAGWMTFGWTEDPSESWLARDDDGEACGWYLLTLPQRENRHLAYVKLQVHPSRRRNGLGTRLVRHVADRARQAGRRLLASETMAGSAGEAFAVALGANRGLTEIHRVLRLTSATPERLAKLRADAETAAHGYSLLSWEGPVPDDKVTQAAAVYAAAADMPREADQEAQSWDAARVRQYGRRLVAQGVRHYVVAAQCDATGELAGLTELDVHPLNPEWGWQDLTVVARPHRGHRLGLLVKVAMLEMLAEREPQLATIVTGNSDGNAHMIAINERLGFEFLNRWPSWELDISTQS